jgi:hypothetical protein
VSSERKDLVAAPHEFCDFADEHFGWAETARTERERAIFLQMAAAWLEVAQQWERDTARTLGRAAIGNLALGNVIPEFAAWWRACGRSLGQTTG